MKKYFLTTITLALSAIVAFATGGEKQSKSYTADTKSSTIEWRGEKLTSYHTGVVNLAKGNLLVENGMPTSGTFIIDMTSIKNTDIEDAGSRAKLEGHLKSDDFFSVATHKTATVELTNFEKIDTDENGNNYMVTADLTIKGITNQISFPAKINITGDKFTATGDVTFDRSKWNVRYGSGSFFDNLGDDMIYDEIKVSLRIIGKA